MQHSLLHPPRQQPKKSLLNMTWGGNWACAAFYYFPMYKDLEKVLPLHMLPAPPPPTPCTKGLFYCLLFILEVQILLGCVEKELI